MKITEVKTVLTSPKQNYLLVKITTEDGIYGWGDCSLNGRELPVQNLIDEYLAPLLIGKDAGNIEEIWQMIYYGTYWRGGSVLNSALSGIDMALWDILGKETGKPLYALLGGKVRDKILCYSHILGQTNEEKIERAAQYVRDRGLKVIRLRAGQPAALGTFGSVKTAGPVVEAWTPDDEVESTIDYFIKVRERVGDKVGIIYDLHERFSPARAIRIINALEPYNPFFIEDPVSPEYIGSLRSVRMGTKAPLAFGELYKTRWECAQALSERLVDFIRCDVVRIGGVTEARKIGALAETYDVMTAWHGPNDVSPITHAVNWHLNASAFNFGIQEDGTTDGLVKQIVSGGPEYKNGYLYMDDAPGIGCDVNEDAAKEYPFRKAFLPYCRKSDNSIALW